ncbi:MAG: hypothetical protein IJA23_01695 [Clostridia bacterium]|nr:hypothetical protein [Clostridia bacterium]
MQKEFVKYMGLRFKKAKLHSWAKERYVDAENLAEDNVKFYYSKMKDLKTMSTEEFDSIQSEFNFEPHYFLIMQMLNEYTLAEPNHNLILDNADLFRSLGAKINYDDVCFEFELEDLKFMAIKLSHYFPYVMTHLTDIETRERVGKCHPYSVVVATLLERFRGNNKYKIYLATDRIYQLSNKSRYLHSWVEIEESENAFVVDATKNLVMDRSAYYEINHVESPEKVDSVQLARDYKKVRKLTDYDAFLVKVYYENAENGRLLYDALVKRGEIDESAPMSN